MVETKGIARKDISGGELRQSSINKEVQKEWTLKLKQRRTTWNRACNGGMKQRQR
ncbi:hypothetical protein SESBI_27886 [Sesbania bispinosa]|nr:hypothetical protein SESBI_27886 [Sesbania bispinosa]